MSGPDDDDSIDLAIVQLLAQLTGREISILWAAKVRQQILGGRVIRRSRMAYVITSITERPNHFLPQDETRDFAPPAPPLQVVPEWCGHCESDDYRWLELADSTWAKCPACNPDAPREATAS
ncbi:hypothetical protein [Streptosporangium sandarakinum]